MNKDVFLSLNNATFSLGKRKLLNEISLVIHQKDKIALVGKNGVGKSTLLNILSSKSILDSGEFWVSPDLRIGILDQKINKKGHYNLKKYLILEGKKKNFSEFKIERVIKEIKLDKNKVVDDLSGGEKRKLALAELLLSQPDLLLLDEPTNHLDIESITWLESFLNNEFKGSFLIISHNRNFLKRTTNKVFWMDRGLIRISSKGFNDFENWKNFLIDQEKRELRNKKQYLDNELEWLNKGVKARRKRNEKRKENVILLKSSYKQENSEFVKSISKIKLPESSHTIDNGPNILINFINVDKNFINENNQINILRNFNFKLMRGKKIGVIGKNGSGKSTFLNLASGKITPNQGNVKIKKKVSFSFFDQSGEQFDDNKSIKENLISGGGDYVNVSDKKVHICGYLKNFLFDPKDVDRIVLTLSGGERNRLLLAKILSSPKEILILDEPTNDLDSETIDLLIDFINAHNGSALISSHDIDFLERTCKNFFIFDGTGLVIPSNSPYLGSNMQTNNNDLKKIKKKEKPLSAERKINRILKKIESKEIEINNITKQLQTIGNFNNDDSEYKMIIQNLQDAQHELDFLEKEWIEIEENSIKNA
jgi:ATP-binding cassette subfamily F protein uup